MKTKTVASSIVAAIVSCACLFMFVPTAKLPAEGVTVTSTISFPSYTQVRKDLTTELTATSVEDNADWGGIENLDVPQTESQAERMPQRPRRLPKRRPRSRRRSRLRRLRSRLTPRAGNRCSLFCYLFRCQWFGFRWCRCLYRPCVFFDRTEHGLHRIGQSSVGGPWH